MLSESSRIPSKDEIMFSLFLPPKIASAVRRYGDVTIFDASASFLSLPDPTVIDKIVWSVRFRRARRTIVRRAAKSGAEKAKTLNFKQESVRIPDTWARGEIKKMQKRLKSSRRRTSVRQRRF